MFFMNEAGRSGNYKPAFNNHLRFFGSYFSESLYILPLIVIVSIPFGIIGAIYGHIIMGFNLSILSMLGIVALSGIVVNDALVLISQAVHLENETDLTPKEIISEFGLIDSWHIVKESKDGRMIAVEVELSSWFYNSVLGNAVLSIDKDYLAL